jgi:hypothetical protein
MGAEKRSTLQDSSGARLDARSIRLYLSKGSMNIPTA